MKFGTDRPFSDPEAAARKLMELANDFEPIQDGRIQIVWPPSASLATNASPSPNVEACP
jgi:hypothetical protein